MTLKMYKDPEKFWQEVSPFLLKNEAEYNLLISIIERLIRLPGFYKDYYLMACLGKSGAVQGAAWMTPPHPLGLTQFPEESLQDLVQTVFHLPHRLSSVVGPVESIERFKNLWLDQAQVKVKSTMRQGLYELRQVGSLPTAPGIMRVAKESDRVLLENWAYCFAVDCKLPTNRELLNKAVERALIEKNRYFWELNGKVVSMSGAVGHTPQGVRIGWVYTPPEERGKGYASALVGGVSLAQLDAGKKFCFLYTDLDNPISNAIYQRIGYRQIAKSVEYNFS